MQFGAEPLFEKYLTQLIFAEIIPTLDLPEDELKRFANDVLNRFRNPYICHLLLSISLNSMTKFKTRILPQLHTYMKTNNAVPNMMALAIAGQILMYKGLRNEQQIELSDSPQWLELFNTLWHDFDNNTLSLNTLVEQVLGAQWHWESDLNELPELTATVTAHLRNMLTEGVATTLTNQLGQ